jgi:hypothetical protein
LLSDEHVLNLRKLVIVQDNMQKDVVKFVDWIESTYKGNKIEIMNTTSDSSGGGGSAGKKDTTRSVEVYLYKLKKTIKVGRGSLRNLSGNDELLKTGDRVQVTDGEFTGQTGSVQQINYDEPKKKGSASPYANIKPSDAKAPEPKMTRYFTLGNTRLFNYLRREQMGLMQKNFRANFGGFVMNDKEYKNFLAMVNSDKIKSQFGDPKINIDQSRSFAEDDMSATEKPKTPLGEFVLSYFDRETGKFPKGETAVLTAVEKDYGDEYIESCRQFIEQLKATTLEYLQHEDSQARYPETARIKRLAGV